MNSHSQTRASDWLQHVADSAGNASLKSPLGDPMPRFPTVEMQVNTCGLHGVDALKPAAAFYADIVDTAKRVGPAIGPESRIIDFGSGWGRITRFFLCNTLAKNIVGLDVDDGFVRISNEAFGGNNFRVCSPLPPTDIASQSIDVISAFSVFSHLSEEACRQWITEFARILKPGGLFAFTTRDESFFDVCMHLAKVSGVNGHQSVLAKLFDNWDEARGRYRKGEFVHKATGGGGVRDSSYYGESFIPRQYVERAYGDLFEIVFASGETPQGETRRQLPGLAYDQACFILKRRG